MTAITFEQIESRPLNGRQKGLLAAAMVGNMLDLFDFFLVGFVLAIIIEPWGLSFGEAGFLLLTSGVGAIVGSFVFGALADMIGRRKCFIATVLIFSVATGALAAVPTGDWMLFGLIRLVVGFGVGGMIAVDVPLVQEFMPSRRRGFLGGLVVVTIPLGIALGSALSSALGPVIGWRGLVLLGLAPALMSLYIRAAVPESPRWLMQQGRLDDARKSIGWVLSIPADEVKLPEQVETAAPKWRHIFRYKRSVALTWPVSFLVQTVGYGIALWGPTLIALQMGVTPARAAFLFIFVVLAGFAARLTCAWLSDRIGRRLCGMLFYSVGAVCLAVTALTHESMIGGVSVFYVMLIVSYFFTDGGWSVVVPYFSEVFPTNLRASGLGAAYGFGGLGKILGPMGLALISGVGTLITPKATLDAVTPAFLYLAGFSAAIAVFYLVLGIETRGKTLDEMDVALAGQFPSAAAAEPAEATTPLAGQVV